MKKKILLMTLGICAFSFAQKTYVTGTLPVKVESKTLFYNGDGLEIKDPTAVITNDGNIQVAAGDFTVNNNTIPPGTDANTNFYMTWTSKGVDGDLNGINDDDGYGQLIINEGVAVTANSKILIERKMESDAIDNVQIAFPFTQNDNAVSILSHSSNSDINLVNSSNRLRHPLYQWNNKMMRWDKKNVSNAISRQTYYIVRNVVGTGNYNNEAVRPHIGTPSPTAITQELFDHSALPNLSLTGSVNTYNEVYKSYIDEYFEDNSFVTANPTKWGKNQYQYGNPYTSNIDLSYIGVDETALGAYFDENGNMSLDAGEELNDGNLIEGLIGVYQHDSGAEVNPVYGQEPNVYTVKRATVDYGTSGLFNAGDYEVLLVKPMQAFVIKTDGTAGQNIVFNDGVKTFSYSPKTLSNPSANGAVNFRTGSASDFGDDYYQVRLGLSQNGGEINRTYVVAQSTLNNGGPGTLESNNVDLTQGLYTKQELNEGGLDPNFANKSLYINQVNTNYLGNAIPVFAAGLNDGDSYTIKFNLSLGIAPLSNGATSYSNANAKYYFHDIYTDEYFEVFNNDTYDFVKSPGDGSEEGSRFELFFGGMVDDLGTDDVENLISTTQVYQRDNDNYIRFDSNWKFANIYVYTAVGQIVFAKENVDTTSDYLLPLTEDNVTTYIVKIENPETGETLSKKVIK